MQRLFEEANKELNEYKEEQAIELSFKIQAELRDNLENNA